MKLPDNWPKKKDEVDCGRCNNCEGHVSYCESKIIMRAYNQAIDLCTNALGEMVEAERERIFSPLNKAMALKKAEDANAVYVDNGKLCLTTEGKVIYYEELKRLTQPNNPK